MKVKWLGHASFLITSQDGTKIVTDPYEPGFRNIINYGKIDQEADIVTISHEHGDHNALDTVPGNPQVVRGVGTQKVKGIEFRGLASYHDRTQGGERGPNTIFYFTVDDVRVCHLGDLGHPLTDEEIAALGEVDILLIPVGGPMATIELEEANQLCEKINPRVAIGMHFKTDKCSFPQYGAEDFLRGKGNARRASASEVEFVREQLPQATEFLILEHAL